MSRDGLLSWSGDGSLLPVSQEVAGGKGDGNLLMFVV